MYLVKLNFIADLIALQSLATGGEKTADARIYEKVPFNSSGNLYSFIFRGASLISRATGETSPAPTDIAANTERRRAGIAAPVYVQKSAKFGNAKGLREYDVSNFYLVPKKDELKINAKAEFLFYKKSRVINRKSANFEQQSAPDAIFSNGKWTKPLPQ